MTGHARQKAKHVTSAIKRIILPKFVDHPQTNISLNRDHNTNHIKEARGHVNTIETSIDLSSSDEEYVFSVNNKNSTLPQTTIKINHENISAIIDTGATIDIFDRPAYNKINMPLSPSDTTIYTYGNTTPINVLGCFSTEVKSKEHQCVATFHVVNSDSGCLLGHKTATDLQLILYWNNMLMYSTE